MRNRKFFLISLYIWGMPECKSWKRNNDQWARTLLQSLLCATDPRPKMEFLIVEFWNKWNWLISYIGNRPEERKRNECFSLQQSDVWVWDVSFGRSSGSLPGHLVGSALYQRDATAGRSRDDEQQTKWWLSGRLWSTHSCLFSHSSQKEN